MTIPKNEAPSMADMIAIYECMGCDVLAKHMAYNNQFNIKMANYLTDDPPENLKIDFANPESILGSIDDSNEEFLIEKLENYQVYDSAFERLSTKYGFPSSHLSDCKLLLNFAAYMYLSLYGQVWMKNFFPAFEEELEKLANAAERFRYTLKPMAEWEEGFNQFFDNQPIQQMLRDTKANLDEIMKLKEKLRTSTMGKLAKLGDSNPIGNLGLHEFIKHLWTFWHDALGRTIIQKRDGINGRKQFLVFLVDCLKPIHPTLVEGHIIDGPVDNALKKFQKSLKSNDT